MTTRRTLLSIAVKALGIALIIAAVIPALGGAVLAYREYYPQFDPTMVHHLFIIAGVPVPVEALILGCVLNSIIFVAVGIFLHRIGRRQ